MTTIEIKRWDTEEVIFSHTCENNAERITVEEAVKQKVSLAYADLKCFNLGFSYLRDIDLSNADLTCTNFYGADMPFAKLNHAILTNAILANTILRGSVLHGANLCNADLSGTDLSNSNLNEVNLINATLFYTCLDGSIVDDIITNYPMNLPEGEFIAWKKVNGEYIIKLKILEDSKRSRATSDKCRCDKALVMEIQDLDGNKSDLTEVTNISCVSFLVPPCLYKVGEIVEADSWDANRFNECLHGIHFFLDREKAVSYGV